MQKTAPLSIRIRPPLKAALEKLAKDDRRSVSGYVEMVLERHVEATRQKMAAKG